MAFVAITNHILDATKTNRAVSLFRPTTSQVFCVSHTSVMVTMQLVSVERLGNTG